MPYNKSFIGQASSVKMAGHWPRSLFAFLWTSTSSRSIKTQKENCQLFCLVTAGPQEHEICAVQSGPGILQSLRRLNNHKSKMINIWKDTWIDRVE